MTDYTETLKAIRESTSPLTRTQTTDYSQVLKGIREAPAGIMQPTIPLATTPAAVEPIDYSTEIYSENDLVKDEYFVPIQDYMTDRFGAHIQDLPREEVVGMFANNMRGFAGGNSLRAVNEITYLNEVGDDEERLAKAGKAYTIYENLQSMFGETSFGEKSEIAFDFARSAIVDPVNLLTLGVGKVATGVGFRGGSQIALIAARQAFKRQMAKGATKEAAEAMSARVFRAQASSAASATAKAIATRQAVEKSATTFIQRMTTPTALKEAAVVGGMEGAISAGTDYLYQDAMLRTKVQKEYNVYQTGLSAVVGLVAGGVSGALGNVGTGASGLVAPAPLKTSTKGATVISRVFDQAVPADGTPSPQAVPVEGTPSPKAGNWLADIAKGRELKDQDTEFFITMLLGNHKKGIKGLAHILLEDGYVWAQRNPDDKVSNWIGDIIKDADPQDAKKFIDDFTAATGIDMVDLKEGTSLTVESFADTFKKKMSDSGRVLNLMAQTARLLGRNADEITGNDYLEFILEGGVPEVASKFTNADEKVGKFVGDLIDRDIPEGGVPEVASKFTIAGKKVGKFVGDLIDRDIPDFQNNIIRLMVSNLSTTALNVTGFAAASGLNSASDITRAALLGGKAGLFMVYKPNEAKKLGLSALNIIQNQVTKARNTLDINTTYDTFLQYAAVRPKALRQLTAILPGGIESLDKITKGLDMNVPLATLKANQAVDIIQRLNLVSAQDGYTKALEFTTQLDKLLRRSREKDGFGMSFNKFFAQEDHPAQMLSEKFVKLEAMAVDETLKAVFSKSYKGENSLGKVAGLIEDARNLPGIGLLIPFGRFFNNTVAMSYNMTALGPLISKMVGGQEDKAFSELASKGIVTWATIYMLSQREQKYIDMGLGWSEEIDDSTGEVVDERYEFPYGAYKAIARLVAHHNSGSEIPAELLYQLGDQFVGQLTRQLGDAGKSITNIATALLSPEGPDLAKLLQDTLGTVVSQAASGMTRPLEPLNVLVGLTRDEEFYTPDRKQGTKWFNNSIRYVDQMVALAMGENIAPPAFTPGEGQPRVQASRLISTTRASKLTNTERIMNMIGRPTYMLGMASQSEAADNRYNEIFNEIVENGAGKLFNSERFKKADLETKQLLVGQLTTSAGKSTKAYMARTATNSGDRVLLKMIQLSTTPKQRLMNTMADLGFDRGLDELSEDELDTLANALKFREEVLLSK